MTSAEYIRHWVHHTEAAPTESWQRLLWMAAELVRRAQHERHTYRPARRTMPSRPRKDLSTELSTYPQSKVNNTERNKEQ